jgi:DNA-binding PadR family transcriptional regulator
MVSSNIPERNMKVKRASLNTSSYVVLGLLDYRPDSSGYELRQLADGTISFLWATPSMSQIYAELDRLAQAGFVLRKDAANGKRPRASYRLSALGRRALKSWAVDDPYVAPDFHHIIALRVLLGRGESFGLVPLLEAHVRNTTALLEGLRKLGESLGVVSVDVDVDGDPDGFAHARIVAMWGQSFFGAEAQSTERALASLRALSVAPTRGVTPARGVTSQR